MNNLGKRVSFVECNARERAEQLLDSSSFREILGPFDRMASPHLEKQGIVPQNDDGVIVAKGEMDGESAVVISIESGFQGGGIGEVSGAKIAAALEMVLEDYYNGIKTRPVIILDTGGIRLQEANYGLLAIAEIQASVVALRKYVSVIGVIPGKIGSFGGMSITAGLFDKLIMTTEGRLGLNGPEVVEQEAGISELDSKDRPLIWKSIGGAQRVATSLADELVEDDVKQIATSVRKAFANQLSKSKCTQIEQNLSLLKQVDPNKDITPNNFRQLVSTSRRFVEFDAKQSPPEASSRGQKWFYALTSLKCPKTKGAPTVWYGDANLGDESARYITVGPDPHNPFSRVREGEIGLEEGWALAQAIKEVVAADASKDQRRPIIAIVDVPSQAYGYKEELLGIHQAFAAAVNAYAEARIAGHPIVALLVGKAISGAFLSHGLQANRLIAFDNEEVNVHVMSKGSAARVTKRTIDELERVTKDAPAMAYDIHSFQTLGALHELVGGIHADQPTKQDVDSVSNRLQQAVDDILSKENRSLKNRLHSSLAKKSRALSIKVREEMLKQWYD
ncbi:malonate decarboxylase beta subunit [Virgibacillus natechei]|uniref:Malonate decarboxylase beta subunit n=1 Tax=Virgibacillus natechei TaxID=1216297 RepID=A0ABS4IGH4_9BACI|nr:biotin-independent malonate decarboxylase subunit beta [Virgibacillus natechei]MBP1970035.1 malonate decarboxylase beta subunit [Virgibacillus natechei]UZD14121.1 biotin-independent malonate decarboxylase subunit beta [Virgibacillus natechei]